MIEHTTNIEEINSVLKHDDIWSNIADETEDKEAFNPPLDGYHYLYSEGILFILHPVGDSLQIHANVLKNHRTKAKAAAQEALTYGFNNLKADRIFAKIPVKYQNVYKFTSHFMQDDGVADGFYNLSLELDKWDS
jgi:hypothetical protein